MFQLVLKTVLRMDQENLHKQMKTYTLLIFKLNSSTVQNKMSFHTTCGNCIWDEKSIWVFLLWHFHFHNYSKSNKLDLKNNLVNRDGKSLSVSIRMNYSNLYYLLTILTQQKISLKESLLLQTNSKLEKVNENKMSLTYEFLKASPHKDLIERLRLK